MNLIEQLGGYEAAKEKYKTLSDSDMITIGPIEFSAKDYFEDELLEYRRQHNIFEVGDKVVYIEPSRTDSVLTIKSMITGDHLRHPVALMGGTYGCGVIMLRHATNEEIKAGKRLEVS